MIDFSKLHTKTPVECEADERQRQAASVAGDRARRRERSTKSIAIELTLDAEQRYTAAERRRPASSWLRRA
jgi:hypothetical protein